MGIEVTAFRFGSEPPPSDRVAIRRPPEGGQDKSPGQAKGPSQNSSIDALTLPRRGKRKIAPGDRREPGAGYWRHGEPRQARQKILSGNIFCRPSRALFFFKTQPRAALRLPGAVLFVPLQGADWQRFACFPHQKLMRFNQRWNSAATSSRTARGGDLPWRN